MNIEIRKEKISEYREVENIVREAFWNIYRPGCFEHLILHNFRNRENYVGELSNVISLDKKVIGQILFSKAFLTNMNDQRKLAVGTFGPVSILPEYQRKGYGAQLINHTLGKAKEYGYKYIVIFGNQDYYQKFEFVSAIKYGVLIEGQDKNEDYDFVLIKDLTNSNEVSIQTGYWLYKDPDGYEVDEQELEEFEKQFPYKEKSKISE
ncbi:MAG: N-acetyltransferase [Tissierellia bacterium]|nr:N-acetyltransferase [Tissierellia bacterium]